MRCDCGYDAGHHGTCALTVGEVIQRDSLFVRQAIQQTPRDYWLKCLAMRTGITAVGSIYPNMKASTLNAVLKHGKWSAYQHPAVAKDCLAFIAPIPGVMRMLKLADMYDHEIVTLEDPKGTGFVSPSYNANGEPLGTAVDYTVLICGQNEGKWVVFTFHPGDPVAPSTVMGTDQARVTVAKARSLGFEYAKVQSC